MLRRTRRRLYLSPAEAALAELDGRNRLTVLKHADLDAGDALADLGRVVAEWARPHAALPVSEIVVDDHWCRFFMVRPPANAARPSDLEFAAATRFESLYDERPADWIIEADWNAAKPFLACAMYRPLLAAVDNAPVSRVASVVPRTIDYCRRFLPQARGAHTWLLSASATRIVVTVCEKRKIADVHQVPVTPDFWSAAESFNAFMEHECLRLNRSPPDEVLVCGTVPAAWNPVGVKGSALHVHREAPLANAREHAEALASSEAR